MSLRQSLLLIALGTVLAWAGWVVVLMNTDPSQAGVSGFALFYLTLFTSLVGVFALLGVGFRVYVAKRKDVVLREVRIALRHAVLLSAASVAALAISAHGWFRWWVLIVLILGVSAAEYLFLLREEPRRR